MKKRIHLYFRKVGIEVDLINHHFKLEFVNSGLYFVQDEFFFINPFLKVGSGSGCNKKMPDPARKKSTDPTVSGSLSLQSMSYITSSYELTMANCGSKPRDTYFEWIFGSGSKL